MDQPADDARIEQDAQGIITDWNAGAERLFGWTRTQVIGRKSITIIPRRNHDRHAKGLQALFTAGSAVGSRRITVLHRDGREFVAELAISIDRHADGDRAIATARPIARVEESAWPGTLATSATVTSSIRSKTRVR